MIKSIYAEYIDRIFPSFTKLEAKVNDSKKALTYYHKTMLRREHSVDQKWETTNVNTLYVAADMVAMDSPLPIKNRPSVGVANGKLPKIGMLKQMKESEITAIDTLIRRKATFAEIAKKLTDDAFACSVGIDEKNEYNFLYAFSRGYCLIQDADNTGTGMRVNFGYLDENTFGVETAGHISKECIERVINQADAKGYSPDHIALSQALYRKLRNEQWAREMSANYRGLVYTDPTKLPVPTSTQFAEAFADEFNGITFEVIDRSIMLEKNGRPFSVKPFADNRMIFYSGTQVGALVWGDLAEKDHPVPQCQYTVVDEFKLIARFAQTNPMLEFTTGQALVLPVIEGVDGIFVIDNTIVQPLDPEDEGEGAKDSTIKVFGHKYAKTDVLAAAATVGINMTLSNSDAELIEAINSLNQAKQAKCKKALEAYIYFPELSVSELEFAAAGATKTATVKTNYEGTVTVAADAASTSWLSATVNNGTISVVAAANTGEGAADREGTITVTAGSGKTETISVSQEA